MENIDYSLVEEKRPPIYTSMKYWGKKPHNIWREYIGFYTGKDGVYLDPFCGSAMSAFESYKAGRKAIALDLNPLSSFIIETFTSCFNGELFIKEANRIIKEIESDDIYLKYYCYNKHDVLQNCKWNNNTVYETCFISKNGNKYSRKSTKKDIQIVESMDGIKIKNNYPKIKFRESNSFTKIFIKNIGKDYSKLFTRRNLYILSLLFFKIEHVNEENVKKQLLFSFIQIVHLSSKMCSPRSKKTNRDFSTSWGRPAYLALSKQMEMNPLLLFKNSCFGKQSTLKVLNYLAGYFDDKPKIANINNTKFNKKANIDIWYGTFDIKDLNKIIPQNSIDFILTDPPYGGLIQYLDLSNIWLSWLALIDEKYIPSYEKEITINKDKNYCDFESDFIEALNNISFVLKNEGTLVLTFNNNDIKTWNSFLNAINKSNFYIEKIIHQQNRRSGESNVSDSYGTSGTDFYIRCKKGVDTRLIISDPIEIEKIIVKKAYKIILLRNEPTPYQILFNGLLETLSKYRIDINNFDQSIKLVLEKYIGRKFCVYKNNKKSGDFWWLIDKEYSYDMPSSLTNRVNNYIEQIYAKNREIKDDEIVKLVFKRFKNGLTPDLRLIYENIGKMKVKYDKRKKS